MFPFFSCVTQTNLAEMAFSALHLTMPAFDCRVICFPVWSHDSPNETANILEQWKASLWGHKTSDFTFNFTLLYSTLLRESMDFVYITFRSESINLLCNGNIALEASFESFLNKCNSLDSSRKKSHNRPKFGYRFGHLWIELYQSQKMLINRVNKLDGSFFSLIRLFIICHFDAHFLIEFANFFCIL